MRKIMLLLVAAVILVGVTACGQVAQKENKFEGNNNDLEVAEENVDITFHAYLADDEIAASFEVPIFIVAHNNTDSVVEVKEDDFHIWMKEQDKKVGQKSVRYEEKKIINVEPHSEGYLAPFFTNPKDNQVDLTQEYMELEYRGDLNAQPQVEVEVLPNEYIAIAEQLQKDWKGSFYQDDTVVVDTEEPQSINGFIPEENRFEITAYQLEKRRGHIVRAHIRVKNVTNEEKTYDATQLTMFDLGQEYQLADMSDSAFDPLMRIPAQGTVDYIDFFQLENDYDQSVEEIMEQIYGVHYRDDQFFEVIDIYGNYEKKLPSDFSAD